MFEKIYGINQRAAGVLSIKKNQRPKISCKYIFKALAPILIRTLSEKN
jgi:CRISPR/Cas system endoribonuclease Cas6 (RAMP superfamily)